MAPIAESRGTLTPASAALFEVLCGLMATLRDAEASVARDGLTLATAAGGRKANPALAVAQAARRDLAKLLREFDLRPPHGARPLSNF